MTLTWTDEQEAAFAQIMVADKLERLPAIRLYRRCGENLVKALRIARECYGVTEAREQSLADSRPARISGLAKARAAKRLKQLPTAA